ncbi:MAG: ABC transporter substrate-binding protein [Deltaproteobacteria bacterium]|nr:ABC transporter substrate-binding protein [Deltaproteobacteria bacterium]
MKRYPLLKMSFTLSLVLIIGLCFIFTSSAFAAPKEVKVGLIYPVSGPLASVGKRCVNGHEYAVKLINEQGGIKSMGGAKIKLIVADSEGKPEIGMSETEKLITRENVAVVMGAWQSAVTFPTTQVAEKYKTPYIVPLAVADAITERGFKYTFRTGMTATINANLAFDIIKWLGEKTGKKAKTVAILNEDSLWGDSTAKTWEKNAGNYGLKVVGKFMYNKAATDLSPTITKMKSLKPDIVLQCAYTTDAILITKQMHEMDFNCMARIPSGGGYADPKFVKAAGKLGENLIVNMIFHPSAKGPGTKVQDTNADYQKSYEGEMDEYVTTAFDATWVLKDALERAASADRKKLRDAISKTNINTNNSPVLEAYDFKFNEKGQVPNPTGVAAQIQNGKMLAIHPDNVAVTKPVYPVPTWKDRGLR